MFRADFPVFQTYPDLIYLDSASSAQKPHAVIEAMNSMMKTSYANIHRGAYDLSERAELLYDKAKESIRAHIWAKNRYEINFTYNATYAFNLLARSLVKSWLLSRWDTVLLSKLEHHANIVPWQILQEEYGILIDWIDITEDGRIDLHNWEQKISNAKVISITLASNVTGAVTDMEKLKEIIDRKCLSQNERPLLIVDGSQAFPHFSTNVVDFDIDFYVATGHKIMSDTGIGFFYGKKSLLQKMLPSFCGGGAINTVSLEGYEPAGLPSRFEPGTPHIIWAGSLLAALEYIDSKWGYDALWIYEERLIQYFLDKIPSLPENIRLIWPKTCTDRLGVFSFVFDWNHPSDIADMLAERGICVRVGHHCTEPLHRSLGVPATLRASLYIYNTEEDIDIFIRTLSEVVGR